MVLFWGFGFRVQGLGLGDFGLRRLLLLGPSA